MVMTNYHVVVEVAQNPQVAGQVICRFDHRGMLPASLLAEPRASSSPLEYALRASMMRAMSPASAKPHPIIWTTRFYGSIARSAKSRGRVECPGVGMPW